MQAVKTNCFLSHISFGAHANEYLNDGNHLCCGFFGMCVCGFFWLCFIWWFFFSQKKIDTTITSNISSLVSKQPRVL